MDFRNVQELFKKLTGGVNEKNEKIKICFNSLY